MTQAQRMTAIAGTPARPRVDARAATPTAGFLLFVLGAQFMTAMMLAASIAPAYEYSAAAISDLGVIPQTALLFNASLVAVGLLNLAGGYPFFRSHRNSLLLGVFSVASVGALLAGIVPLDRGEIHSLSALVAFVFFNLEAVGTGFVVHGPMRTISIIAGGVGLAFTVLMIIGDAGNPAVFGAIGHGGAERMIVYPVMIWLIVFGGSLMGPNRE